MNNVANPESFTADDLPITLEDPNKAGFVFVAWHDAVSLDSIVTQITAEDDAEVWAEFTAIPEHTVTLSLDGGTTADYTEPFDVYEGTTYGTLLGLITNPTKDNYLFEGWYTDAGKTVAVVSTDTVSGNVTFYAKYDAVNYGITYNLNGGTNDETNPVTFNADTIATPFVLLAPIKAGHTFVAWYLDVVGQADTIITQIDNTLLGSAIVIFATWTQD